MSAPNLISSYRNVLREIRKASITPRATRSKLITSNFRQLFETARGNSAAGNKLRNDMDNAITFMRAQREYQDLLVRYNPLHDMSPDDHRLATAHRVGLNMPKSYQVPSEAPSS